MRSGTANLPLHAGRAPAWLFSRMVRLAREITSHIVAEYGSDEVLRRLSDPYWFQAFGCVLGFDWHFSSVTTTIRGAVKEGLRGREHELGVYAGGGKGAVSRRTPAEIAAYCDHLSLDPQPLVYASRMAAKVDSAAVQDGYQLYHHAFFSTRGGGPKPAGSSAIVHTHPTRAGADPKPSPKDHKTANRPDINIPVYAISSEGIWKAQPGCKEPINTAGRDWVKGCK